MVSSEAKTTRGNLGFFLLGVFTTLCVTGIFSLGSALFFQWQRGATPLVTGEEDLDKLIQTDVNLFWTLVPNLKNKQVTETLANTEHTPSTYTYSTNEMGFRSPPLHPPGSRFRILAIGDSTTFGQHLADVETWPAQLHQILDPKEEVIEVVNAGVIGASSFQGLAFLYTRGLSLKPDLVIATFGFNDWAGASLSDRELARANQRHGLGGMLEIILQLTSEDKNHLIQRATPGEYLDHMLAIAQLCAKNGIHLLFIIWPKPYSENDPEDAPLPYMTLLIEACTMSSVNCIDLTSPFREATEPVFLDCVHATPAGCRIVAETLAAHLQEIQWLPITK